MSLDIALTLTAIAVLLLLSAFFNGSETALTAASRARMHALEQEGNSRAALVNKLLPDARGAGAEKKTGRQSQTTVTRSPLTMLGRRAALRYNQQ